MPEQLTRSRVMSRVLGVDQLDPDLNDFADSVIGRSISESIMKNGFDQETSDLARQAFAQFKSAAEMPEVASQKKVSQDDLVEGESQ